MEITDAEIERMIEDVRGAGERFWASVVSDPELHGDLRRMAASAYQRERHPFMREVAAGRRPCTTGAIGWLMGFTRLRLIRRGMSASVATRLADLLNAFLAETAAPNRTPKGH